MLHSYLAGFLLFLQNQLCFEKTTTAPGLWLAHHLLPATMYNGIGLQTPRGSGTNGYVQRNLAFVKSKKDRVDYKDEDELRKLEQSMNKQPNQEILDHERKRKVELKCMEMQELMEEQG